MHCSSRGSFSLPTLRDNVLIVQDAIADDRLRFLIEFVRRAQSSQSLVSTFDSDSEEAQVKWVVDKRIRDTQEIETNDELRSIVQQVIDTSVRESIEAFYNVSVRDFEPPQILQYGVGGHYIPHTDADTLLEDELGLHVWEKALDRDLSIVYFLNGDFDGGELVFPEFDFRIKPAAGTLVCFPSDHNYVHGVMPVTRGVRYSLVTWMRVEGTPTPDEINRQTMELYNRMRPKQIEQPPRIVKAGIQRQE